MAAAIQSRVLSKARWLMVHWRRCSSSSQSREGSRAEVEDLFKGMRDGKRSCLARAITLVESSQPASRHKAQELLNLTLEHNRGQHERGGRGILPSFRIGLSGAPGSGKSTFIETWGKHLTSLGLRVAVLAVDPSSVITGGSLLGDKTRMPELTRDPNAFIRPSPTGGHLGGATRATTECISLFECAGYDVVIVETVGVGQSEHSTADMTDMFVLLLSPGGGDELQGIKRGIVERSDLLVVTKNDGDLIPAAQRVQYEYTSALKYMRRTPSLWRPKVLRASALTKSGIPQVWEAMCDFRNVMSESGELRRKRREQKKIWMWTEISDSILQEFKQHKTVKEILPDLEEDVQDEIITPGRAADELLSAFFSE